MTPKDFTVGQVVYYYGYRNRGGNEKIEPMIVCHVGRKWVEASINGVRNTYSTRRFAPPCMLADGGDYSPPGEFMTDVGAWEESRKADSEWYEFLQNLPRNRPKHVTSDAIAKIAEQLKPHP